MILDSIPANNALEYIERLENENEVLRSLVDALKAKDANNGQLINSLNDKIGYLELTNTQLQQSIALREKEITILEKKPKAPSHWGIGITGGFDVHGKPNATGGITYTLFRF